jgi:hypothetical protein
MNLADIPDCVICGRLLKLPRMHVDTCGTVCYRQLLKRQRTACDCDCLFCSKQTDAQARADILALMEHAEKNGGRIV